MRAGEDSWYGAISKCTVPSCRRSAVRWFSWDGVEAEFSLPHGLNMPCKILENCLPSSSLHLDRVSLFRIEGKADRHAILCRYKFDLCGAITEGVINQLVIDDLCIGSGEIKTHAAVFGFHA